MHSLSFNFVALAAITAVVAAPTKPVVEEKQSFKVAVNARAREDPRLALYRAQQKFAVDLPFGNGFTTAYTLGIGDLALATVSIDLPAFAPQTGDADSITSSTVASSTPSIDSSIPALATTSSSTSSSSASSASTSASYGLRSTKRPTTAYSTSSSSSWTTSSSSIPLSSASSTSTVESTSTTSSSFLSISSSSSTVSIVSTSSAPVTTSSAVTSTTFSFSISPTSSDAVLSATPSSSVSYSFAYQPTSASEPAGSSSAIVSQSSAAASQTATGTGTNDGAVAATPVPDDSEWVSPVTIGGQAFTLDFDTGSADLWVFSTELPASDQTGRAVFDSSKSSTWSDYSSATWSISYGDNSSASGSVGFDTVTIGGVTATKQCIELAEQVSSEYLERTNSDGLLGLGFSAYANTVKVGSTPMPQKTFFETVMSSLKLPVFTADLDPTAAGTYEFGEIDASKYTGDISYVPVDPSHGYWEFASSSYAIGGKAYDCPSCVPLIADTGTTLLLLDSGLVQAYYTNLGASSDGSLITIPCDATLPDLQIGIGSFVATIPGSDLNYGSDGNGMCLGGVQVTPSASNQNAPQVQILGDIFFKKYFAIFDGGNTQFGVATKA